MKKVGGKKQLVINAVIDNIWAGKNEFGMSLLNVLNFW